MRYAVEVERRGLRRLDHVADRDLFWGAREHVPASRATRTAHDPGATKPEQDLLDVVAREALQFCDFTAGDRTFVRAARQMERTNDTVLGERSDAHGLKLAHDEGIRNGEGS